MQANKILTPFQKFTRIEIFTGILLMRNAIIALIWANLSFTDCYFSLWNSKGGSVLQVLSFTNLYYIGLMIC
jgi:NhaA family Na+:H+ antiporter